VRSSAPGAREFRVLGDQPYSGEDDPFGFAGLARDLKTLILASRASTPFTIGIEASWGRGKSSLMAQLHQLLENTSEETDGVEIRPVSFNAWTAEGQDVLEGLVKSVLAAMDKNALRRALRNERLVSAVKVPILLLAGFLRVGGLVDEAWSRLSVDARTRNQVNALVTKAMEDWFESARNTTSLGPDRLLVVFIDDLDRCSPANVLKIFEGLKLYLDAPGFVFVLGYDEGVVGEAVAEQKQYSTRATGRDYIEKIVQIVFRIPQPTDEEVSDLLSQFLAESQTTELFDDAGRKLVIDRNGRNPRRIKRFVNRFILDYQLDEASQDLNAELLIKLLIFETYFPDFARLFAVTGEKNPLQEFLDFAAAREQLRRGDSSDAAFLDDLFRSYGITRNPDPQAALERLEQEAPEVFPRLARDDDFLSLAQSLAQPADQALILAKVQRRRERDTSVPTAEEVPTKGAPSGGLTGGGAAPIVAGRRILWVDDTPANNAKVVDLLRAQGAQIEVVENGDNAAALLRSFRPDVLVSDIGRGSDPNAGFDDLTRFREAGLYSGPVVFFTSRISTSRRNRAVELGASIAGNESELLQAIGDQLASSAPAGSAVA
jgi:CheY-like chemotaxis protein